MKKFIAFILLSVLLTGCGNSSMGIGNYQFNKIHIDTYNYSGCLTIDTWYDGTTGVEVETKEAGSLYVPDGMYILIENKCPFCEE